MHSFSDAFVIPNGVREVRNISLLGRWTRLRSFALVLFLAAVAPASAQMGMDLFRRPAITKAIHPVVGKGAEYQTINKRSPDKPDLMELGVVGKDTVDGKDAFWMQFSTFDEKGQPRVGKALVTVDDFQFHKMIMEIPGQGAMEMPMNMSAKSKDDMNARMNDWHSVGSDTITVPAGTFSCEHWRNDKDQSDIWTTDKVTPFGMVKEVRPNQTTVLVKVLDNVTDRITGPVKKFDMQQMMQQMQQQRQQPNQ
jgi:hypothetical protein